MTKDDVISAIKNWHLESINFRNDGWVQSHYKRNIEEVFRFAELLSEKVHVDEESIDDDNCEDVIIICDD